MGVCTGGQFLGMEIYSPFLSRNSKTESLPAPSPSPDKDSVKQRTLHGTSKDRVENM